MTRYYLLSFWCLWIVIPAKEKNAIWMKNGRKVFIGAVMNLCGGINILWILACGDTAPGYR